MADLTSSSTVRQGIIVMDPRITADSVWTAESTGLTQAGPVPGVPVPQRATRAVLQAHGEQAAGASLRVLSQGTGMVWRPANAGTDEHRGWNPPSVLTGWEAVRYLDGAAAAETGATFPHACTMSDGTVVGVYVLAQTTPSTRDVITCSTRTTAGVWSHATIEAQSASYSITGGHPAIVCLPNDRLVAFWMVETSLTEFNVRMGYSDDSGATWTIGSKRALPASLTYEAQGTPRSAGVYSSTLRMRAAYKDGQILLVIGVRDSDTDPGDEFSRDILLQYASYDLGHSFAEIAVGAGNLPGYTGRYHDIAVSGGYFWLAYVSVLQTDGTMKTAGYGHVRIIKLGSAGQRFDRSDSTDMDGGSSGTVVTTVVGANNVYTISGGDCAIFGADDGIIYVLERYVVTSGCYTYQSSDQGRTWVDMGLSGVYTTDEFKSTWWYTSLGTSYPTSFCATWQRGRALVLHSWVAVIGNEDSSIGCAYLGGYTTATMPIGEGKTGDEAPVKAWCNTWLPIELPGSIDYTAGGTAGAVESLTGGAMSLPTAANTRYFDLTLPAAGTIAEGYAVGGSFTWSAGSGSLANDEVAVRMRLADGVSDYDVSLRFSTAGARAWDNNAAAELGATTITLSAGVDFLVFFGGGGRYRSWVRVRTLDEDGVWTVGPTGTATNDGATPAATHLLRWGHLSAGTNTTAWYLHNWAGKNSCIAAAALSTTNPDDLYPRRWWPDPVYVDGGTSISMKGGPAFAGDSWLISARYLYAVERIFPPTVASPLVGWRSVADGGAMYIAVDMDTGLTAEHYPGCDTIGLAILGANWRTGELQGYTGGAWATIGVIDAAGGPTNAKFQSLGAVRLGNTLRPNTSATNKPWVSRDELVGWTASLDGVKRRVVSNSAGKWDSAFAGERPTVILEGVDVGDPATPTVSFSPPDFVHVYNLLGATHSGYRIKIDAQATVDGDYRIGSMLLGPLLVHGYEPAWGSSSEVEDLTEAEERADGSIQSRSLGKPRRIYEWGWDEIDESRATGAAADPDYLDGSSSSGGLPVASLQDTVASMVGTYRRLLGRHGLCCVVRTVPVGSTGADTKTINRWSHFVFGRITSPLRVANVLGRHGENEVVRLSSVTLTEER